MSVKPPNPLDEAQELFEAGSVNDAARLLHRLGVMAAARGRDDVLAEVNDLVSQMRAYLKGGERDAFDSLVAHGELGPLGPEKQPPSGSAVAMPERALTSTRARVGAPPPPGGPINLGRRAVSTALDLGLLGAALLWALLIGITIGDPGEVQWLALVWAVLVGPLYFALYHAYGTGATPGQQELGMAVRAVGGNARIGLAASLARSYMGLLVLPVLLDALLSGGEPPTLRDRLTRSRVLALETAAEATPVRARTVPELADVFEPARAGHALGRALRLVRVRRRELVRSVLAVYLGLVAVAAVLAPLFIDDFQGHSEVGGAQAVLWTFVALLLFASGIYWKQAAISTAVEAIRTGERIGTAEILRRTFRRVNALSAALVLFVVIVTVASIVALIPFAGLLLLAYPAARLIFVVPAIVVEDRHVLDAFRRSFRLTRTRGWRIAWKLVVSALATVFVLSLLGGFGFGIAEGVLSAAGAGTSPIGYAYTVALGLALASVPASWAMAVIGTTWVLLYHDLRRVAAVEG